MREALYQLFRDCTVRLETNQEQRGTGFFVSPGQILTCAHVVSKTDVQRIQIRWQNITLNPIKVETSKNIDLAILQVNFKEHPCVYFDTKAIPGDAFYSYGYPDALEKRNGASIRVEYEGTADDENLLTLKGENIRPGFSGAPVLNQRTLKVCGLIKSERSLNAGKVIRPLGGYALPLNKVLEYYPTLKQDNYNFHQKPQIISIKERDCDSSAIHLKDLNFSPKENTWVDLMESSLNSPSRWSRTEVVENFRNASSIGREWLRKIDGEAISREELKQIVNLIEQDSNSILLKDCAGSGKTCLLLDLAEYIENDPVRELLFIKGDFFDKADSEKDLAARGLPEDIVGQCSRLAEFRRVVVILDSLDVLSISRQHKALQLFLGLMDRLARIDGVTIVAACRTFDLEYDPLLRGRSWQQKINLQPLDFDTVVDPFLRRWNIEPSQVNPELRELLQIPQNLSLYGKLAKLDIQLQPTSAYELCNSFLEETVIKNSALGEQAIAALQSMADSLMEQRTQQYSKTGFKASQDILRQLISQEVLLQPKSSPYSLKFTHQTLADCLVVRSNLAAGKTLADFILAHPQLPYIRPAVRTFFFFLRTQEAKIFNKQVWQVINHDEIAYHVKVLICESFAEITPHDEDWNLLRRIFQQYPDLFKRLFWRVGGKAWFELLNNYWLPEAKLAQDKENWLRDFVLHSREWANLYPKEVISLWRESIDRQWAEKQNLLRLIQSNLKNFQDWNTNGTRKLLEILVEEIKPEFNYLGDILSKWVGATGSGDDLLWRYITKDLQDIAPEDLQYADLSHKLRCQSSNFHKDSFLKERLCQSNALLTLALNTIEKWINETNRSSLSIRISLYDTSCYGSASYSSSNIKLLLCSIERALCYRALNNDTWWQKHEPRLRTTDDLVIRYFVIQAYKKNIQANVSGIEFQLQDEKLLGKANLKDKLGELMQIAYPLISPEVRLKNQEIVLSWIPTEDNDEKLYRISICYKYVIWIPVIFRTQKTQSFIETWEDYFGCTQPFIEEYARGGMVMPPLSPEELLKLSDKALLCLFTYYQQNPNVNTFDEMMIGGLDQVLGVLYQASSLHPQKFLDLFFLFIKENLHQDFLKSIVRGVASYLIFSFGNSRSTREWKPIEPLPDGEAIAAQLLNLIERYNKIWSDLNVIGQALQACSHVLDDLESAERITLLLFWLRARDITLGTMPVVNSKDNLYEKAINLAREKAAEASIILCNRLLEQEKPLPELLPYLLRHFARDSVIFVRVPILIRLYFLMYKSPQLGWQLLADCLKEPEPRLWEYVERSLYYQYRNNFNLVEPYLNRLFNEAMDEAGEIWGRISTLASLAGHISQQKLFQNLERANSKKAWNGATQVFVANFDLHHTICHDGIMNILRHEEYPVLTNLLLKLTRILGFQSIIKSIMRKYGMLPRYENLTDDILLEIESCFNQEKNRGAIKHDLARAFLKALPSVTNGNHIYYFLEWLGLEAHRNPLLSIFDLVETLAKKIESEQQPLFGDSKPLIIMLNAILREADKLDDPQLIQRAINLQDRFLKLDIPGMEQMLNKAAGL